MGEIIDLGVQHDIVDKAGSWYSYGDDRIGQGKENVREFLKNNPAWPKKSKAGFARSCCQQGKGRCQKTDAGGEAAEAGCCGRLRNSGLKASNREMIKPVHEEISDLLSDEGEDRFSSPLEARKKAMDFLARREYGQTELIRKLADKGFRARRCC